jgi:hypothetical protein
VDVMIDRLAEEWARDPARDARLTRDEVREVIHCTEQLVTGERTLDEWRDG